MITGDRYRITVLTDRLIRLEYSDSGIFEDRKTFAVISRDLDEVSATVRDDEDGLIIETDDLYLKYDKKPFSSQGLSITLKKSGTTWNYGDFHGNFSNLLGTARTLDEADGGVPLEKGIFGTDGYAVLDDSRTPILDDGEFMTRDEVETDIYFFGYGKDYYGGLRDFCRLCGNMPMIPRYAYGNWWSRYYKYTEKEYLELVENFAKENIPLSVAVIDMDWHVTDIDPKYGTGWTGYSWNKEFFPDYKRFLKKLHDSKLSVTLNLHPADGIRAYEDMYKEMAKELCVDPDSETPLEFDFADKKYRDAYFKTVMHPYEKDGVDFWWIDWQQGTGKKCGDVDPLLLLNHYHYEDQKERNTRPMIFSRYAGPGSHRYPVGFSGDTHITWKSLAFQPFFTSTASNIGYGLWSHDIGGHMLGDKNYDRLIRWIEYGVFSPIMRIHSSCSPFLNKEPWTVPYPYRDIMRKFMQLRHALIPYLYTENRRSLMESKPLIRPMYYDYSDNPESYNLPAQYGFGDSLLVSAITSPDDEALRLGCSRALIPAGRWIDIFNGRIYEGEEIKKLYRDLSEIPVLLPAGGIVPMAAGKEATCTGENSSEYLNDTSNPEKLRILIGGGKDGQYTLYEDDGISMEYSAGAYVETRFEVKYDEKERKLSFRIGSSEGDTSLIPSKRAYTLEFMGIKACGKDFNGKATVIEIPETKVTEPVVVELENVELIQNDYKTLTFEILDRAWISNIDKDRVYDKLQTYEKADFANWLTTADISENLKSAICEIL